MIEVFNKEKIIEFLRNEDEIANLNMIGAIENIGQGIFGNPEDRLRMYVDDRNHPNGVIVQEHQYWHYVYAKNETFIHYIKESYFAHLKEYGFDAVDKLVYDILLEGETMDWHEVCTLLYLNPSEFVSNDNEIELTDGTVDDARLIDDMYTYKEEGSYEFIYDNLKHRPSSVYRVDGKAVAWVLLHRDNSMGIMYTKKEFRGKNIAYQLSTDIIKKVIAKDQTPFIHIGTENTASFKLASKCGFKRYKEIYWFGIKR